MSTHHPSANTHRPAHADQVEAGPASTSGLGLTSSPQRHSNSHFPLNTTPHPPPVHAAQSTSTSRSHLPAEQHDQRDESNDYGIRSIRDSDLSSSFTTYPSTPLSRSTAGVGGLSRANLERHNSYSHSHDYRHGESLREGGRGLRRGFEAAREREEGGGEGDERERGEEVDGRQDEGRRDRANAEGEDIDPFACGNSINAEEEVARGAIAPNVDEVNGTAGTASRLATGLRESADQVQRERDLREASMDSETTLMQEDGGNNQIRHNQRQASVETVLPIEEEERSDIDPAKSPTTPLPPLSSRLHTLHTSPTAFTTTNAPPSSALPLPAPHLDSLSPSPNPSNASTSTSSPVSSSAASLPDDTTSHSFISLALTTTNTFSVSGSSMHGEETEAEAEGEAEGNMTSRGSSVGSRSRSGSEYGSGTGSGDNHNDNGRQRAYPHSRPPHATRPPGQGQGRRNPYSRNHWAIQESHLRALEQGTEVSLVLPSLVLPEGSLRREVVPETVGGVRGDVAGSGKSLVGDEKGRVEAAVGGGDGVVDVILVGTNRTTNAFLKALMGVKVVEVFKVKQPVAKPASGAGATSRTKPVKGEKKKFFDVMVFDKQITQTPSAPLVNDPTGPSRESPESAPSEGNHTDLHLPSLPVSPHIKSRDGIDSPRGKVGSGKAGRGRLLARIRVYGYGQEGNLRRAVNDIESRYNRLNRLLRAPTDLIQESDTAQKELEIERDLTRIVTAWKGDAEQEEGRSEDRWYDVAVVSGDRRHLLDRDRIDLNNLMSMIPTTCFPKTLEDGMVGRLPLPFFSFSQDPSPRTSLSNVTCPDPTPRCQPDTTRITSYFAARSTDWNAGTAGGLSDATLVEGFAIFLRGSSPDSPNRYVLSTSKLDAIGIQHFLAWRRNDAIPAVERRTTPRGAATSQAASLMVPVSADSSEPPSVSSVGSSITSINIQPVPTVVSARQAAAIEWEIGLSRRHAARARAGRQVGQGGDTTPRGASSGIPLNAWADTSRHLASSKVSDKGDNRVTSNPVRKALATVFSVLWSPRHQTTIFGTVAGWLGLTCLGIAAGIGCLWLRSSTA